MPLRVGTIHKAFDGVEAKYGTGRILGRFTSSELTEPRATAAFLHLTLEQQGTDFAPLFGQPVFGTPGYDPSRYFADARLSAAIAEIAQGWKEAEAAAGPDRQGALARFVAGDWGQDPTYPTKFAAAVGKLSGSTALRALTYKYFQHGSVAAAERPRVGGPRGMRLFRALLSNGARLSREGGLAGVLKALTKEYLTKKELDPALVDKEFPRFSSLDKGKLAAHQYARFLEARLSQSFLEVTPNMASYALRDLARHGGAQLLAGTEHSFFANLDSTNFIVRSGLAADVDKSFNPAKVDERGLREVHVKAFDLVQTEFIQTYAELSERFALAARERLV